MNPKQSAVPTLALRRAEAARALGISNESFDRYVRPDLRVVRIGGIRLYAITELQRWLDQAADESPATTVGRLSR